ncbi:MAG: SDR family NAD(P)-dependent oxidoreductase [Gemmatimonadales bacterium]|jgi:3-oxoacyl-[acyl-carrier protein] reductase
MKLKDRVAIVTGGGRGIGRAIAEALAAEGARVVVTAAREQREIEAVAAKIGGAAVLADVSSKDAVQHLVDAVLSQFGRIDILVNNAARGMKFVNASFMTDPRPFWEADPDAWRMVIDTNVSGVFLMTRSVIPHMLARRAGRIINVSINRETMRRKGFTPYGPSKAALESMNEIWAQDLEGTGITMNLLLPGGATDTGMIPDSFPAAKRKELIDPAVMGPPAVYLASDEAGGVNGQRIVAIEWRKEPSHA